MSAATGMAIAANMKVLNDGVQVEINAVTPLLTEGRAHSFGKLVGMGQRVIGGDVTATAQPRST